MTQFAAIPTVYKGVQFRSRLEARWAAFFDAANLGWQYEPFDLNGWIPDFTMDRSSHPVHPDRPALIEIKPLTNADCNGIAPRHVTGKIERALDIPTSASDFANSDYLNRIHHIPMLVGCDPSLSWVFAGPDTWLLRQDFFAGWEQFWAVAGNSVQWKAPRHG